MSTQYAKSFGLVSVSSEGNGALISPPSRLPWGLAAACLVVAQALFVRRPPLMMGTDTAIYARIASEFAQRPLSTWLNVTLEGVPFFEHPPGGFWLEALWLRVGGDSPAGVVGWARVCALVGAALLYGAGRAAVNPRFGFLSVVAVMTLPAFLQQAHIAMLEAPLSVCAMASLWALHSIAAAPARRAPWATVGFACAVALGWWVKGPPMLAILVPAAWLMAVTPASRMRLAVALFSAGALTAGSVLLFEWLRARQGLPSFFSTYWQHQVTVSFSEGRNNAQPANYLFYAPMLVQWYGPAVIGAIGTLVLLTLRRSSTWATVNLLFCAAVVAGFSVATQKYNWYLHLGLLAAAVPLAMVLSVLLPEKLNKYLVFAGLGGSALWAVLVLTLLPVDLSVQQRLTDRLQRVQFTKLPPGSQATVADCGELSKWIFTHSAAYFWNLTRVDCSASADYCFTGDAVVPLVPGTACGPGH